MNGKMDRYRPMLTEVLALAAEARIRANEYAPGYPAWEALADGLYRTAVGANILNDTGFDELGVKADAVAIGRVGEFETGPGSGRIGE